MNLIILFWLNSDNFVGVIIDPMIGDNARMLAIQKWEMEHGYNNGSIMGVNYYMELN